MRNTTRVCTLCMMLWIVMGSTNGHKSSFERIQIINSQYDIYNDSGRIYQVDMKIPVTAWRSSNKNAFNAAIREYDDNLWDNAIIPYKLAYSIRKNTQTYKILMGAMKEWERKTCIKFVERSNQPDYVEFYYGDGCNSDVGRVGGRQTTSLGRGCAHHGIIVHELGHLIGFWHEQNRPDRDTHVQVLWDNIIPKFQFAFTKYSSRKINSLNVPYDYYSVMHYGSKAFSKNHKATIRSIKQDVTEFGNNHISSLDAKQANILYKCPDYPKFPEDFYWKHDGPGSQNSLCINFNEPQDPHDWHNNFLCHRNDRKPLDLKWSHRGLLSHMKCIRIAAPKKNSLYSWDDNFLCWPRDGVYTFSWQTKVPSTIRNCLNITEPSDPEWSQCFLCATRDETPVDGQWGSWEPWSRCSRQCGGGIRRRSRTCSNPAPSFGGKFCRGQSLERGRCNEHECEAWPTFPSDFTYAHRQYRPSHEVCIRTYERLDYFTWNNYLLCTPNNKRDLEFQWSDRGIIPDMICTRIFVPTEISKKKGTWDDNYLCMPKNDAPYRFRFSASGAIAGLDCMRWYAKGGHDGWDITYLCAERTHTSPVLGTSPTVARPINGRWSIWTGWSSCSKTCGGGVQRRTRSCTNPAPLNGGRNCQGRNLDERGCNIKRCPMSCGGKLVADGGRFTSPDFPNNYPDNSDCVWVIKAPRGKIITLQFNYLDIEGPSCRYDFVVIRDGPNEKYPRLNKFCGSRIPQRSMANYPVRSTGNYLWIRFKSDNRINHKGFDITWTSSPDPLTSTLTPVILAKNVPRCGGVINKDQGSVTSPSFPTAYPHNLHCIWIISADPNKRLNVWFDHFYIDKNNRCKRDYIEIKDGNSDKSPSMGRFCGNTAPVPFKSNSNSIAITFHSDSSRHHRGFRVRWRSVNKQVTQPTTATLINLCPKGWVSHAFGDNTAYCYLVKRNYHTWFEARRDCRQNNADLLSVLSKEEENFVINDLNRNFNLGESFMWMGLNDRHREGQWAWSDRTPNTYNNWAPGDPNDGGYLKNEDCGVLKPDGQWNDYPCNSRFRYICKARPPVS